ncbi:hypothetical protein AV521_00080 [Streptomyces sp. IMTB 2501]|uniref:hypothetical protein n=1 Tax=Streptomyces sp. IMTB 2501 TaxID=1776340 RepID=UPI00096CFE53|nr:hypothetical protein [Streptomyces sp. IMTB 2501]OLZ74142.1 hypothetical protein AV521_00080 [Streptomyces sp. IMTB 2501]
MARPPQPRHITLGGREAVALTLEEYEQLVASRRQIGGQSARVRVLARQAKRAERLLHDLETLMITQGHACQGHPQGDDARQEHPYRAPATCPDGALVADAAGAACLRCAVAALLRRHRDPAA